MSRYIQDIKVLCRSHVNDIIRIKKKIIPKSVERFRLNMAMKNNFQVHKNYVGPSFSSLFTYYKYTISFSFTSKNNCYVRLFWGVLLEEFNELISEKVEVDKNKGDHQNTVICIDNFKNFFKDGFSKSMSSKQNSDATTLLLDKKKEEGTFKESIDENFIDFNSGIHKTQRTFFPAGNNIVYRMPYEESECVVKMLNKMELEKKQINELMKVEEKENKKKGKKRKVDIEDNDPIKKKEERIRVPLIILINDIPTVDAQNINQTNENNSAPTNQDNSGTTIINNGNPNLENYEATNTNIVNDNRNSNMDPNESTSKTNGTRNDELSQDKNSWNGTNEMGVTKRRSIFRKSKKVQSTCNTLLVLVDFKKTKDRYKANVIKDICVLNKSSFSHRSKKKSDTIQFIDILDIYGHEEHDKDCLICMNSYKDTLLIPCRHSSFCFDCMKSLRQEKCPICRCLFTSYIKFPLKNVERSGVV